MLVYDVLPKQVRNGYLKSKVIYINKGIGQLCVLDSVDYLNIWSENFKKDFFNADKVHFNNIEDSRMGRFLNSKTREVCKNLDVFEGHRHRKATSYSVPDKFASPSLEGVGFSIPEINIANVGVQCAADTLLNQTPCSENGPIDLKRIYS